MSKTRRQLKQVYNKIDKNDIIVKIDRINMPGKPLTKGTKIIHGKKYDIKNNRKRIKIDLKKYLK